MNLSRDGYIAAPGNDLGWSVPSDELFQWWSDQVGARGLAPHRRTSGSPALAGPAEGVVSSTTSAVDWTTRS